MGVSSQLPAPKSHARSMWTSLIPPLGAPAPLCAEQGGQSWFVRGVQPSLTLRALRSVVRDALHSRGSSCVVKN